MNVERGRLSMETTVELNDGNAIPILGFGTFQVADGAECERAVLGALEVGYRHIDTAHVYGNESSVGRALAESGVPREEVFVTTKTPFDLSPAAIRKAFEQSLRKLRVEYVDLYLIHWPMTDELGPAWETLEQLRREGKCKSIGVSNFTAARFEKAFWPRAGSAPAINQVEVHVFNQRRDLVDYCRRKGIQVEAYSPLARARRLSHPVLKRISQECGRSPAQVMIRWLLQKGIVAIPKSVHRERIEQNAQVFDFALTTEQMETLDGLDEDLTVQDWHPKGFY